jgi:hypothetical protein
MGSRALTVRHAHDESSASRSIQTCTASWRTVNRSTAIITPPQAGHFSHQSGSFILGSRV